MRSDIYSGFGVIVASKQGVHSAVQWHRQHLSTDQA